MPMDRRALPDGTVAWSGPEGTSCFTLRATSVVVGRVVGHGSIELGRTIRRELATFIHECGPISVFTDWSQVTGYDSRARNELTAWTLTNLHHFRSIHVLVHSKIVAMGLGVANLAIGGGIQSTSDLPTFRRGLRRATGPAWTGTLNDLRAAQGDEGWARLR